MSEHARKPRAFSLPDDDVKDAKKSEAAKKTGTKTKSRKPRAVKNAISIEMIADEAVDPPAVTVDQLTPPPPPAAGFRRTIGWGKWAFGAFTALLMLGIGLYFDQLVRDLFARNELLGWTASALVAIGVAALLGLAFREIRGLAKLRTVTKLRLKGDEARRLDDLNLARDVAMDVSALFVTRPDTAHGRALLAEHSEDIMDGSDLIHLVERDLLAPLDRTARKMVMNSAKRVSVVTAVSPRALVDVGYVLYENMRLVRVIAEHYGGRPGTIGFWRLARKVITHLAATGAIAVGDGLLQQIIGHGVAARLSARLGEGVVNGLLTARIGIAAIDVCRPLAFDAEKRPGVSDFLSELTKLDGVRAEKGKD